MYILYKIFYKKSICGQQAPDSAFAVAEIANCNFCLSDRRCRNFAILQNCNCKLQNLAKRPWVPAYKNLLVFRYLIYPESAVALQKLCIFAKSPWGWPINFARIFWVQSLRWRCKNCKILQHNRGSGLVKYLKTGLFLQSNSDRLPR